MRILLVDDDVIARKALSAGLVGEGYEVVQAGDGEEALIRARESGPDLILSDLLMPRMDGYSLGEALREEQRLEDIPLVFYSAVFQTPEDESLGRAVGARAFIRKDGGLEQFAERLAVVAEEARKGDDANQAAVPSRSEFSRRHESVLIETLQEKVTELEAQRRQLECERRLLDEIVRTIPDVVFVLSLPDLEVRYIAPEAEHLLGFSRDSVLGEAQHWQALVHEEDMPSVMTEVESVLSGGGSRVFVSRMRHKDGSYRWIECHLSLQLDTEGHPTDLVGVLSDISVRHEADERLREGERRLRTLVSNLPGVAYRCKNNQQWDMEFVSDAVEALTGYSRHEVEHSREVSYASLIHPEDRDRVWREVQQALKVDKQFTITYRALHRDGSLRWLEERGRAVDDGHHIEGYINDVTRRIQTAQQLERLNRVLHTLSSGNRSMVKAKDEAELLDNVCRVLSSEGAYPSVWVAIEQQGRLVPMGSHGAETAVIRQWLEGLPGISLDRHLLGDVLKGGKPYLLHEVDHQNWSDVAELLRRGRLKHLLLLPLRYRDTSLGLLGIFAHSQEVFDREELLLLDEMASDVGYGLQALRTHLAHQKSMQRVQRTMLQTIEAVSVTLEKRDPYTAGHQQRVVQLAVAIAADMGLEPTRIEGLRLAALVHDIGKIHIPAEILNRPGRLSDIEFGIIKAHPEVGYDILKGVEFDWPIADIVLHHHERCDGSGYPQGLTRDEMEYEACIIGVADVVEAITSDRPYRPGLGLDVALDEIANGRGSRYDEAVVDSCMKLFREGFDWNGDSIAQRVQLAGTVRPDAH